METLKKIVDFLDSYLEIHAIKDSSFNGLQIEGGQRVGRVLFAVDAGILTFERAVEEKADLLVVHHGHFWQSSNPSFAGWNKRRMDILYKNGISLYAVHLPLDRHPVVGNNAQLLKILGAQISGEFLVRDGKNISWTGEFVSPVSVDAVAEKLRARLRAEVRVLAFGPKKVRTIALCSGGGGYGSFSEALDRKVDLYLTGDAIEIYHSARDAGMHVIFAGHHATETVGLQALMKVLGKRFSAETVFADIATGL